MIKVMISGINGAMGRNVLEVINEDKDTTYVCGFDKDENKEENIYNNFDNINEDIDVVIDFSHFSVVNDLISFCKKKNIPLVCATTGLDEEILNNLHDASKDIPIFQTGNFSYGINVLEKLVETAAKLLGDFDAEVIEKHHNKKVDAPSGTAYMLAEKIKENSPKELEYKFSRYGKDAKREEKDITIHAVRGGSIVGTHEVLFAGADQVIEIKHSAYSKKVFAYGAVKAAKFLVTKKNGYYNMKDM